MRVHADERRTAYCGLFLGQDGDTNLFVVNPGQRTCWHRHAKQHDQFRVLRGRVRFGVVRDGLHHYRVVDDLSGYVTAEPGQWHGYENIGDEPAYLLMYLSRKYDPLDEDSASEQRIPWAPPE